MSKPFAVLGAVAILASVPPVVTGTRRAVRRLGGRSWKANIIATVVVGFALLLRVPVVRRWIVALRRRRCGSLLSLRTWLITSSAVSGVQG